jgi:hypothetical protein
MDYRRRNPRLKGFYLLYILLSNADKRLGVVHYDVMVLGAGECQGF